MPSVSRRRLPTAAILTRSYRRRLRRTPPDVQREHEQFRLELELFFASAQPIANDGEGLRITGMTFEDQAAD
jgi:hypothetical protein